MTDEVFQIEPAEVDVKDKKAQRRIIWVLVSVFCFINLVILGSGVLDPNVAANIVTIKDVIFWFNMSTSIIIASFFGVDMVSNLLSANQIVTLKKIS